MQSSGFLSDVHTQTDDSQLQIADPASFHFPSKVYTRVLQPNGLQQPTNRRPTSICHTSKIFSNCGMISENINNSSIIIL